MRRVRRTLIAAVLLAAVSTIGLWLWGPEPRRDVVFRSSVGDDLELLVAYQDKKGRVDADRLMFGDESGTLSYAFVKDGHEPKWVVEVANLYPDAYRGFGLSRDADGNLVLTDVARGYFWTVDADRQVLLRRGE